MVTLQPGARLQPLGPPGLSPNVLNSVPGPVAVIAPRLSGHMVPAGAHKTVKVLAVPATLDVGRSVKVAPTAAVEVGVLVLVGVAVAVAVGGVIAVAVAVGGVIAVAVAVGGVVAVAVAVAVSVTVGVGVIVGVAVAVGVDVAPTTSELVVAAGPEPTALLAVTLKV